VAAALLAVLASCGGGSQTGSTSTAGAGSSGATAGGPKPFDIRRYLGPDYCPELRIRPGDEVLRKYAGRDEKPSEVVWQASIGETARECLYELDGTLTLRIGASGRVVAGPRGEPGEVRVPLRFSVVKYKEAVLASELYPLSIIIPPTNSAFFSEVRELKVASPHQDRDYIIYVGLDEEGKGLLEGRKEKPPAAPPPVASAPPPAPKPPAQRGPRVLDAPNGGIILPGQEFDETSGD
jgi:hypothetical protein